MMDLGGTVKSIAERTGFSETTVRRRVGLSLLDPEKFRASSGRGATLADYAGIAEIGDADLRDGLLDQVGTPNFGWALREAKNREESAKTRGLIIAALERFAVRAESPEGLRFVRSYAFYPGAGTGVETPADAGSAEYFFVDFGNCVTLYAEPAETPPDAGAEREAEKREGLRVRREALDAAFESAYALRHGFVRGFGGAKAKKHIGVIAGEAARLMTGGVCADISTLAGLLGVAETGDRKLMSAGIAAKTAAGPEYALLAAVHAAADSPSAGCRTGDCRHFRSEALESRYLFLERLGYEASDAERALLDGSHGLYVRGAGE
jgi:ParB family chromosome partitioning protein